MQKKILKVDNIVVDSHCHLTKINKNVHETIQRAEEHGVKFMLTICAEKSDAQKIREITRKYSNVFGSFGIHPEYAEKELLSVEEIIDFAKSINAIAIGETGLDYFYDASDRKKQKQSFKNHILAASKLNIPVIIHSREAEDDTIAILEEMKKICEFKAILHCYSSKHYLAEYAVKNNIYVSASGIITFNKTESIRETFKLIPKDLLLVETDSPFLAPTPFRGKECEPAMTTLTVDILAKLHNTTAEKMAKITTQNFRTLFKNVIK